MKLADVMGHAGLAFYAEVAMVLFIIAFIGIAIVTLRPGNKSALEADARLPFDDDSAALPEEDTRS